MPQPSALPAGVSYGCRGIVGPPMHHPDCSLKARKVPDGRAVKPRCGSLATASARRGRAIRAVGQSVLKAPASQKFVKRRQG